MNKYKLGSRLILGSLVALFVGGVLWLEITLLGFWKAIGLLSIGFTFWWVLFKLIEISAEWSVKGEMLEEQKNKDEIRNSIELKKRKPTKKTSPKKTKLAKSAK